jgi:D-mannonate dehydratase
MIEKKAKEVQEKRTESKISIPLKTQKNDVAAVITAINTATAEIGCGTIAYNLNVVAGRLARQETTDSSTS